MPPEPSPPLSPAFHAEPGLWILAGELDYLSGLALLRVAATTPPDQKTLFLLETPGGLAHLTLGLYQLLRPFSSLEVRAIGSCASAGIHILQAGSLRTCYTHSQFFSHAIQCEIGTVTSESADGVATQFAVDLGHWINVLTARTKKKKATFWKDWLSRDRFFSADDALKMGLVDRIL
jgi:ATP-dependent protease ClpP protease subunit